MAHYLYQAYSKAGKKVTGTLEANSIQNVREQLLAQGMYPVIVEPKETSYDDAGFLGNIFKKNLSLKDKIFFTQQLSVLLKSGISLAESIDLMTEQTPAYMKPMLKQMHAELKEGESFAHVLSMYPRSFPPLYIQLVRAGEASGQMENVLVRLAQFLEEEEEFKKTVSSAVRGPLIQLGLILVVAGVLLTMIVPRITKVITSMGNQELPTITQIVMSISDFLLNHYIIILVTVVATVISYQAWARTKSGKVFLDSLKLKIPLVKFFTRMTAVIQFSQTLGLLLEAGVNISEALDIVVQIVDNSILVNALETAKENIIKQGQVAQYLEETKLFSAVSIHLIKSGEQSGALDTMLNQVGKYTNDMLREFLQGLTALLNPLSMVILALVVGTIIFAVMAPLMNMTSMMG